MKKIVFCSLLGLLYSSPLFSQEAAQEATDTTKLSTLEISDVLVDDIDNGFSAKKISKSRLKNISTTDVARALKESPGVYIREEDGVGLRPNIGLRGTNPDRSKKVVIMEDGVLIGPAPYAAPAAYYTPSMLTTESLEVFKGFTALPFGPNSIGGAVNYKTPDYIAEDKTTADVSYGSYNTGVLKLGLNKKVSDYGVVLIYGRSQSDGFKELDNGKNTGFEQNHVLLKVQRPYEIAGHTHLFELRLGYGNEDSHETYLGLTENDFLAKPYRRYNSSELDQMKWTHKKIQLEHLTEVGTSANIKTTAYHHEFERTWYRLDGFRDSTKVIRDILKDPTGTNQSFYEVLSGVEDSANLGANADLLMANNDRVYFSQGLQSQVELNNLWSNEVPSKTVLKALIHRDQITRKHDADYYSMTGGSMIRTGDTRVATARNEESATALSLSAQDESRFGKYTLLPQFRYETVTFNFDDELNSRSKKRSDSVFIPGLGLAYQINEALMSRFAVNKAATLSGLDSLGKESREESLNKEISLAWQSKVRQEQFEILYFHNDYDNITGTCTASTGCSALQLDQQYDGGKAVIQGIEARASKGFQWLQFWMPVQLNYTIIDGHFADTFVSSNAEWGTGQVNSGDPLPYVPQTLFTAIVGLEKGRFKQSFIINHLGKMYDQSVEAGRIEVPSYGLVDYTAQYQVKQNLSVRFKIDNIFNKTYTASLKPFGYRPGKPFTATAGLTYDF